jgi:DNA-binding NtrC family response regulator
MNHSLCGRSVLIVEDEVIIGMMLSSEIARAGGISIGPVTSVAAAMKEIESRVVDTVILDGKLIDGSGAELVGRLEERRIPYVVVSGYDRENLPGVLKRAPFVAKPISMPILLETIQRLAPVSEWAPVGD